MATGMTHQRVLRDWLLSILGELGGSASTASAITQMGRRYGEFLLPGDQEGTERDNEPKWHNRTRYERKNMERAGLLAPASESRGVWTLTEIGREEYRRLREIDASLMEPESAGSQSAAGASVQLASPEGRTFPERVETTVQRVVRSTTVANFVKRTHDYRCQVCGTRLATATGAYAEAAHIRAIGRPHNGPDVPSNVLCLCPNHHVLFDLNMLSIDDDLTIRDSATGTSLGRLREIGEHPIGREYLAYHRAHRG
ncbi:HNH endonuclease [Kitasatospora sp. NPDC057223]|uniref:HNH endonuclease n=1 Tax=Kitasatospora sp. NPDC057223 TaxID=3346055 RepID=UPI003624E3F0